MTLSCVHLPFVEIREYRSPPLFGQMGGLSFCDPTHPLDHAGSWQLVMEVLVMISIVVNALLMSLTSSALSQFYGIDLVAPSARLSTFIVIEHFLMFFMFAVKYMIPDVPGL